MEKRKRKTELADRIKAELLDFLLADSNAKYELLVNEAPFLQTNRWADLIAIRNGKTIGFEIKSERDNLCTLTKQISDYVKVFNMVYLVLAEKFIDYPELANIPKNIGIIIVKKDHNIVKKRNAIPKALLNKSELLTMLWRKDLEELAPTTKNADIEVLRNHIIKNYSTKAIQTQIIKSLKSRYADSYRLFLKDRGSYTTIEDILTITKIKKNPVLSDTNIV
jgi:uncharacterized protein YuzE